eukprot:5928797-Amphidinium_carterae.1
MLQRLSTLGESPSNTDNKVNMRRHSRCSIYEVGAIVEEGPKDSKCTPGSEQAVMAAEGIHDTVCARTTPGTTTPHPTESESPPSSDGRTASSHWSGVNGSGATKECGSTQTSGSDYLPTPDFHAEEESKQSTTMVDMQLVRGSLASTT